MISNIQVLPGNAVQLVPTPLSGSGAGNASDEIVIQRIAAGDKLAMHVLYTRHHVRVLPVHLAHRSR